jgi:hypothetical protein
MFCRLSTRFCSTQTLAKQLEKAFFEGKLQQGATTHCWIMDKIYLENLQKKITRQTWIACCSLTDRHMSLANAQFSEITAPLFQQKQNYFDAKIDVALRWKHVVTTTQNQQGHCIRIAYNGRHTRFFIGN